MALHKCFFLAYESYCWHYLATCGLIEIYYSHELLRYLRFSLVPSHPDTYSCIYPSLQFQQPSQTWRSPRTPLTACPLAGPPHRESLIHMTSSCTIQTSPFMTGFQESSTFSSVHSWTCGKAGCIEWWSLPTAETSLTSHLSLGEQVIRCTKSKCLQHGTYERHQWACLGVMPMLDTGNY